MTRAPEKICGRRQTVIRHVTMQEANMEKRDTPPGQIGSAWSADTGQHGAETIDLGPMPQWDLSDLYDGADAPALKADLDRVESDAAQFQARYRGKICVLTQQTGGGATLAEAVIAYEELSDLMGRLGSYAGLLYASDTQNAAIAKFYGDTQERLTAIGTKLLFFELELNQLTDGDLERALAVPALARYRPWLMDVRKEKPYQLEERLEEVFHEKAVTGRGAWNRLFNETMTALRFDVEGESLAVEPALNLLTSHDGEKRRKAAEAISSCLGDNLRLFTLITNTLAKDKEISDRWRGFEDVADSRHLANRVERPVVEALVEAACDAYPRTAHRYYTLKAKWFGCDALPYWDRNAPLPQEPSRIFDWSSAQDTVLEAYGGFSPVMSDIAKTFFDKGWIDAPVREGKSPGAFSHPTVPSAHPYILLNYQGKPRDVMTLAHELGHGVHQVLAAGQGPLMAPTPLTLAETASVFGEMLTFQALLKGAQDSGERKALLASKVEDMLNTVVRQIAFYRFERNVHEARRRGELTSEQIGEIWMRVQGESLGPAINLNPGYEVYWAYIPHFIHSPFYVYAYAFGDCLVNSLYAVYEQAEDGFAEKYFDMLRAGGSKHHSELLKPFGLDAADPAFWAKGLSVIERMIDTLEDL